MPPEPRCSRIVKLPRRAPIAISGERSVKLGGATKQTEAVSALAARMVGSAGSTAGSSDQGRGGVLRGSWGGGVATERAAASASGPFAARAVAAAAAERRFEAA